MLSKLFVTFGNESHILFYAGAFFAEKNTEQINEMKRERKKKLRQRCNHRSKVCGTWDLSDEILVKKSNNQKKPDAKNAIKS